MIALDLTPTEEAEIRTIAHQTGLAPADYLKKLVKEHLPSPAAMPAPMEQDSEEKRAAAVALMESWIDTLPTDPEEIRWADAERNEFLQNLNRNRIESGERPLLP